jgi:hypothetical protein
VTGQPFATPADLRVRGGEAAGALVPPEVEQQTLVLLRDISAMIRSRRRGIDAWIAAGRLDPELATAVTCQVAQRILPLAAEGRMAVKSETHPEYAYELSQAAIDGLWLTRQEYELLSPTPIRTNGRAFSVQPG